MIARAQHTEGHNPGPWGLWATAALGTVIACVFLGVQIVVAGALFASGAWDNADALSELESSGFFLALSTSASMVVCVGLMLLFAGLRRHITIVDYFHLTAVSPRAYFPWVALILVFAVVWDLMTTSLGRELVPEFMQTAYATARSLPLFWFALVVAAPLTEEFFFRGFLFEGIRCSRLGAKGAVLVTSLAWASVHLQYDLYEMTTILVLGMLFGIARLHTGSLYVPIALHALTNLLATAQTALYSNLIAGTL